MLLAADGALLAEAGNTAPTTGDPTGACGDGGHPRRGRARTARRALKGATLYASTEPCADVRAAAYLGGIGRVVFGLREADLPRARGGPLPWLPVQLPAAEVASRGRRPHGGGGAVAWRTKPRAPHAGLGGAGDA